MHVVAAGLASVTTRGCRSEGFLYAGKRRYRYSIATISLRVAAPHKSEGSVIVRGIGTGRCKLRGSGRKWPVRALVRQGLERSN